MNNDTIVVMTTAACHLPARLTGQDVDATHLTGLGLLIAQPDASGRHFELAAKVTNVGEGEAPLLAWAAETLPAEGRVVGWRLAENVIPPLLRTAEDAEPELSHRFLQRLYGLLTTPSDDLALDDGGAAAPSLPQHLLAHQLMPETMGAADIQHAWTNARTAPVVAQLRAEAVALLHLWSMRSLDRAPLRVAMGRWLAEQRAAGLLR